MNRRQTNKLESYTAVEAALKSAPEIAALPGLPVKLDLLSAKIDEIKSLAKIQTQPIRASTAKRDQLLDQMAGMTLEIAGYVTSVAREQNLPDLLPTVDVGSGLRRARRTHRLVLARRVLEAAQSMAAPLATLGVTGEKLEEFEARIQAADAALTIPRSTVVTKKAATVKLASLFEEVDELLKDHIDRLVYPLRTHVELYATYRAARSIVDRRGARRVTEEEPPVTTTSSTSVVTTEKAAA